jgi:hypothetical protein
VFSPFKASIGQNLHPQANPKKGFPPSPYIFLKGLHEAPFLEIGNALSEASDTRHDDSLRLVKLLGVTADPWTAAYHLQGVIDREKIPHAVVHDPYQVARLAF